MSALLIWQPVKTVLWRRPVAGSRSLGANINWGASDHELFFNDVDITDWRPFAWKLDPFTDARQRLAGTVYHVSPDGRWLVSANLANMRRTQPGYGVRVPDHVPPRNVGPVDDDGLYITDTLTGKSRLMVSIRDLLTQADPPVRMDQPDRQEIYAFHGKFNPQGDRLMLSLRWFLAQDTPQWDMFSINFDAVRYAWVTMPFDGGPKHCAVGPEQWEKGGHHATWFPDGRRISMNLSIDRGCLRFVQVNADGSGLRKMGDNLVGSGHPTMHPDGRHLLADAYVWEEVAFGDGTIPLRWIDLSTESEKTLVRINTESHAADAVLRVDAHPAWDRTWRYVTFNAFVDGTRRVFIADMESLI